jgi:hypothetical protein
MIIKILGVFHKSASELFGPAYTFTEPPAISSKFRPVSKLHLQLPDDANILSSSSFFPHVLGSKCLHLILLLRVGVAEVLAAAGLEVEGEVAKGRLKHPMLVAMILQLQVPKIPELLVPVPPPILPRNLHPNKKCLVLR